MKPDSIQSDEFVNLRIINGKVTKQSTKFESTASNGASAATGTASTAATTAEVKWQAKLHIPLRHDSSLLIAGVHYHQKEIILGMCAALIVFLFILTMFCATRRNEDDDLHAKCNDNHHNSNRDQALLNEVITIRGDAIGTACSNLAMTKH